MSNTTRQEPLPEPLPEGECILWQGAPGWAGLARGAFRIWHVAAYFGVLGLWRAVALLVDGAPLASAITTALWFVPLALACIGILLVLAWLSSRATTYTITSRRVILQIGVALPITMNIPFGKIGAAALRPYGDDTGDIPLTLVAGERMPYWALWPHARPWRFTQPEPMLRAIPDAAAVAGILADALAATGPSTRDSGVPASTTWAGAPEHAHQRLGS
ncbi:MAG: photosynthetic complex putative assembly protein PuhB [Gammaproteobacteria bacterium]